MLKGLSIFALIMSLAGLSMGVLAAQESSGMIELSAPRAPRAGESVEIQITTGPLPRGARIIVMNEHGETLGVVTPFNVPGTASGTTATVPVPRTAMADGRLRLRLQLIEQGVAPRAPRPGEVQLTLVLSSKE
jgi:hypothetical protein